GTTHEQLSSCFLLDSPQDSLESIYSKYGDIAQLSKFSGGIGVSYTRVRSRGSLIKSTNGHSNGIVPWLKTMDSSVAAVNQGGKRKGAACVYLETWHADIEDFLELRDNTGDEARRAHNLNLANWVPDLFMKRVEADQEWSL
ncbi:ribonucleoside-diphosphate reductase subunit alpha, partial [Neisseria gonorrhoeae]